MVFGDSGGRINTESLREPTPPAAPPPAPPPAEKKPDPTSQEAPAASPKKVSTLGPRPPVKAAKPSSLMPILGTIAVVLLVVIVVVVVLNMMG